MENKVERVIILNRDEFNLVLMSLFQAKRSVSAQLFYEKNAGIKPYFQALHDSLASLYARLNVSGDKHGL